MPTYRVYRNITQHIFLLIEADSCHEAEIEAMKYPLSEWNDVEGYEGWDSVDHVEEVGT